LAFLRDRRGTCTCPEMAGRHRRRRAGVTRARLALRHSDPLMHTHCRAARWQCCT
jgi:hypothetical protein